MAASNELEVKLSGDNSGLTSALTIVTKQFERLQKLASLPNLSFAQQERLNKLLLQTQSNLIKFEKAAELANKAAGNQAKGTAQATNTLVNFNRVVQDAPFGLIGIANNIEPLLTSFQNLSKETGGGGKALKALAATFSGPAGIVFAVSAATSAILAFGPQISAALSGITAFDKGLLEGLKSGGEAAKKAQLEFSKYAAIINDSNVSAARQKDALDKVNSALAEYGLKVNSVASFQKNSAQISALFIQLKQEEAKAQALAAKAAEEYAKQIEASFKGAKAGAKGGLQGFASNNPLAQFFAAQQFFANKTIQKSEELEQVFTKAVEESNKRIQEIIASFRTINGVQEDFGKKTDNNTKRVFKYAAAINGLKNALLDFQVLDLEKIATAQEKIFNPDPAIKLAKKQQEAINIQKADRTSTLVLTEEAIKKQAEYSALIDAQNERYQQQLATINAISGVLNTGIDQFFNAIANNQDPFKALAQSAQRLVVELAAAVVKALALQAVTAAFSGGASLGVGGLAGAAGGGGGGLLDLILRGDLLSGAVGRSSTRRRGF